MASAEEAIKSARERLQTAYFGLEDMEQRPHRFHSGLMNAVVFSRMVTFSLQNMSSTVDGWGEWYADEQATMKSDPEMKFFIELRNVIEKTSSGITSTNLTIHSFSSNDLNLFHPQPPGATAFIMGSHAHGGASGWEVKRSNGEVDFFPVSVPKHIAISTMEFLNAPTHLKGIDVREAVKRHLKKLAELLDRASAKFLV